MSSPFQSFEVVMLNAGFQGIELQESDEVIVLSPLQNESDGVNGLSPVQDGFGVIENFAYGTLWELHPIDETDKNEQAQSTADVQRQPS
jgi:hypothetical protein